MASKPTKVSLINVADYPRGKKPGEYSAHWEIFVFGDDTTGYKYGAKMVSNEPCGWFWNGELGKNRPIVEATGEEMPMPAYPVDPCPKPTTDEEKIIHQDHCQLCLQIWESNPKAYHVLEETNGEAIEKDEADTICQEWVLARIENYKIGGE